MSKLQINAVESRRQWRDFFELRRFVYRDDPNVVYPLRFVEQAALDPKKHPFYEHAQRQAFVAYKDGKAVGRIAAIIDHLHNSHYGDRTGFFGFFECVDDVAIAKELLIAAETWLAERDCQSSRGPVNPSMKSDFGVLVKGNDDPPFVMMGYTPFYYERLLTENGYQQVREFFAFLYDVPSTYDSVMAVEEDLLSVARRVLERYPQLKIGGVTRSSMEQELRNINQLANQVRSTGWGFVPLTDSELDYMIKQLKRILLPEMLLVAYWGDRLVGYCINVPDVNWSLRKCVGRYDWLRLPQFLYWMRKTERTRVIGLGADEEYRKSGVGILLSCEMRTRGVRSLNFQQWEFSWVDSENVASVRAIGRTMPLDHYKTLRLYEKPI